MSNSTLLNDYREECSDNVVWAFLMLYSMKIKEQTRKLATGCSKHSFEIADKTDEVSSKHGFEVVDETDEVSYLYLQQGEADVV